jgi:hypothetical protein
MESPWSRVPASVAIGGPRDKVRPPTLIGQRPEMNDPRIGSSRPPPLDYLP